MVRSFVHTGEVLSDRIVHILLLSGDLNVSLLVLPLDFSHYRVAPLDLEHLVSNLVELLHVASSEQVSKVLYVLEFIELFSYGKLLNLLLYLVGCPVPHRLLLRGLLLPLSQVLDLPLYLSLTEVLVRRSVYSPQGLCHILCCALSIGHVPEGTLLEVEMREYSTN